MWQLSAIFCHKPRHILRFFSKQALLIAAFLPPGRAQARCSKDRLLNAKETIFEYFFDAAQKYGCISSVDHSVVGGESYFHY